MRQIFGFWYALFLIGGLAILTLARVNDGAFLVLSFDGDAIHMAQIVLRMADGELPHQDFRTPLGAMAFLPIVWLVNFGFGIGAAFAYAPVLLGIFVVPALWWAGVSRLAPSGAMALGALVLVQLMAAVHGGAEPTVAASMYYNNWCWAVAAVLTVLAVLPNIREGRQLPITEALILGLGVAFLALTKATYAAYLGPVLALALLLRGEVRVLITALGVCVATLVLITWPIGGTSYWSGYVADLLFVSGSAARAQPGDPLALMLLRPVQLVAVIGLAALFLFLRQARVTGTSLVVLVLALAWCLITHQNWQNDPHWLGVAGLLAIAFSRDVVLYNRIGWPLQSALRYVGAGFLVLAMPLWMTQAQSLLIHNSLQPDNFRAVFTNTRHDDLRFKTGAGRVVIEQDHAVLGQGGKPTEWQGETLPNCQKKTGLVDDLVATGAALDELQGTAGKKVFYADWVNALWLFSNTEPLKGGAPWSYGYPFGIENADFLVVPLCPMGQGIRRILLEEVTNSGFEFSEVERNDLFILMQSKR